MKPSSAPFVLKMVFGVSFLFILFFLSQSAFAASTIEGRVFDKQRNPLQDIEMELLDDYYRTIQRTRTDSTGKYQFSGLRNGRYTIRAYAFRYDFQDQEIPLEVDTQSSLKASDSGTQAVEGSGFFPQDFYLLPKKGGLRESELGLVFAQDIPKEAANAFKKATEELAKKRTVEGIAALSQAIQLFPTYYSALYRMGQELYLHKKYVESVQYFLQAVKVNPKSATSFYYIGLGLHNLGKDYNKASLSALSQAHILAPASVPVIYLIGKIEREQGQLVDAEKHLLEAKKLSAVNIAEIHNELYHLYNDDLKKYKEAADELELFLKATKLSDEDAKKVKKTISDLRAKASAPVVN